jgi:hypothetical protein
MNDTIVLFAIFMLFVACFLGIYYPLSALYRKRLLLRRIQMKREADFIRKSGSAVRYDGLRGLLITLGGTHPQKHSEEKKKLIQRLTFAGYRKPESEQIFRGLRIGFLILAGGITAVLYGIVRGFNPGLLFFL